MNSCVSVCRGLIVLVILFLALGPRTLEAQLTESALKGSVVDASGAVVPACAVAATNEATGMARSARTDAGGAFHLVGLPPGLYTVTADSTGFQPFRQRGLRLAVGDTTAITITLPLAEMQETVEVTSSAGAAVAVSTEGLSLIHI